MARKSGFVRRGNRMVRETSWIGISEVSTNLAAANTAVLVNLGNAALEAEAPFTIIRTRIHWSMRSDQTAAAELQQVAFGVCVANSPAVVAGIASLPTPFTDLGSDVWLMHEILATKFTFVSGVGFESVTGLNKDMDSKAMRKVEEGENVVFILENGSLTAGTDNLTAGRMLIKLH